MSELEVYWQMVEYGLRMANVLMIADLKENLSITLGTSDWRVESSWYFRLEVYKFELVFIRRK